MMLLMFIVNIATTSAQSHKLRIEFLKKTGSEFPIPVLFLNNKEFMGDKKQLLSYEVTKSVQPDNSRYVVLHESAFHDNSNSHSIFQKRAGGYWEQLISIRIDIPVVKVTSNDVFVTIKDGNKDLKYKLGRIRSYFLQNGPPTFQWQLVSLSAD